jgi:hypothetical protein
MLEAVIGRSRSFITAKGSPLELSLIFDSDLMDWMERGGFSRLGRRIALHEGCVVS